jgi:hypothetical protein
MSGQRTSANAIPWAGLVAAIVFTLLAAVSTPAQAAWVVPFLQPVRATPPDQSWMTDVPEKEGAHPKGKVAVFVFKGDDIYEPVRAAVVRLLRAKGLNVTATLRPVDSAAQYREMSYTLNLGVFVEGEMTGEGARQSAVIHLRSGLSGQRIATAKFSGPTRDIVGAVGRTLWPRVGGPMMRACSSASRPRRREREPLRIEAGTPTDNGASVATEGT